jgi:hypothetical protein
MSTEAFAVERSGEYRVRLELLTINTGGKIARFISQKVDRIVHSNLPVEKSYELYQVGTEAVRSGRVTACVKYGTRLLCFAISGVNVILLGPNPSSG